MTQPTHIKLNPNEYTQGLHYYPFAVNFYWCVGNCNSCNKSSVPNKTEDLNLSVFNMVTEINKSRTLTKHVYVKKM